MKSMKFARAELQAKIHVNREQHRKIFEEAQAGYRKAMIAELDERLREAREGKKMIAITYMREPEDHTKDYDRVLLMLDMCADDFVELGEREFGQYVMDDWDWKRNFLVSNSAYSMTATAALSEYE